MDALPEIGARLAEWSLAHPLLLLLVAFAPGVLCVAWALLRAGGPAGVGVLPDEPAPEPDAEPDDGPEVEAEADAGETTANSPRIATINRPKKSSMAADEVGRPGENPD